MFFAKRKICDGENTLSKHHGMNNIHDDARTSSDPQATIDLLSRRVAQLKKDLADRDAALQR